MTNFDFLKSKRTFDSFADAAIAAEKDIFYRPVRLCPQLPQGDGVCRKMDVLGG